MAMERGMVIYFTDGTNVAFDFPEQFKDKASMIKKVERMLEQQFVMVEVEEAVLLYPVANIKSISIFPIEGPLPEFVIRGATIRS